MTPQEQDKIDDAVDFVVQTKNGIVAEVNQQNTVIKAGSIEDIATFLGVNIKQHVKFSQGFDQTIKKQYPLLELVEFGLKLNRPTSLQYKCDRILIAVYDDCVFGIAPYGNLK